MCRRAPCRDDDVRAIHGNPSVCLHPRAIKTTCHPRVYLERPADTVMHESVERDNLRRFTKG